MKKLFLFANAFPFGSWEPFLETEAAYYDQFDEVHIFSLMLRPDQAMQRRPLDPAIQVHPIAFRHPAVYALNAVRVLGAKDLWRELRELATSRRLSPRRLVQLGIFLSRCDYEARQVVDAIRAGNLVQPSDEIIFYAYRTSYQPLLMERVRRELGVRAVSVGRSHRSDLYEEFAPAGYLPLRQRTFDSLDWVYPVADHGAQYLRSRVADIDRHMTVDHLGTIDHGLAPIPDSRTPLRVVSCSTIVPVKRLHLLVEALSLMTEFPVEWTHFGDGALRDQVEELAREILPDSVKADFRGAVNNAELMDTYLREPQHVLVNVSSSEGIPVSMMEALSLGIPVVGTKVGGVAEIIEDRANGFLLDAEFHPAELASILREIHDMKATDYQGLRTTARSSWENGFRAESNYPAFVAELFNLLDSRGSSA